ERIFQLKIDVLGRIWKEFRRQNTRTMYQAFENFREEMSPALNDDILYYLLKEEHMRQDGETGWDWRTWSRREPGISERNPAALERARDRHEQAMLFHSFIQFVLTRQWDELTQYANERQVDFMIDMPFAPADARVWQNPGIISIGDQEGGYPRREVQGVPGKKETPLGQIWQFSVYDFQRPAASEYLRDVFQINQRRAKYVRFDHAPGPYQVYVFLMDVGE
ncbi:MAG: 4-alpha-glucanotransferase, partial [Candidatus Omnitrophica bacterium]|nr:4-alpha-glucanotransferase [Candidatus Omnitrophota bacterium]